MMRGRSYIYLSCYHGAIIGQLGDGSLGEVWEENVQF